LLIVENKFIIISTTTTAKTMCYCSACRVIDMATDRRRALKSYHCRTETLCTSTCKSHI